MEDLIGPRSDERGERIIEDRDVNNQPLYFAFLRNPDAIVEDEDDHRNAKEEYARAKAEKPEIIKMCARKTYDECRNLINPAKAA